MAASRRGVAGAIADTPAEVREVLRSWRLLSVQCVDRHLSTGYGQDAHPRHQSAQTRLEQVILRAPKSQITLAQFQSNLLPELSRQPPKFL